MIERMPDIRILTTKQLAALRRYPTPTIVNAIETFGVRDRLNGYSSPGIQCLFPELGSIVGYAATATILSNQPAPPKRSVHRKTYWTYTQAAAKPIITVMQDLSEISGGAYWGEVNSNMHKALGSQGVITNGTVRDIPEVRALGGFHFFAGGVHVSHGWAHLEDFNRPVKVFGMLVHPGDLIHADQHGACVIPHEISDRVAAVCAQIDEAERPILHLCRSRHFNLDELDKLVSPEY